MVTGKFNLPNNLDKDKEENLHEIMSLLVDVLSKFQPASVVRTIPPDSLESNNILIISIGKNAAIYSYALKDFIQEMGREEPIMFIFQAQGYYTAIEEHGDNVRYFEVPHPLPNHETLRRTGQLIQFLRSYPQDAVLHFIVTGGGSSCFALPEQEFTLEQYYAIAESLLNSGFTISQINSVRSLIDRVKGGKFLSYTGGRSVYTWAISDVISNNINIIGSGPTIPCPNIDTDAESWLEDKLVELGINTTIEHLSSKIEKVCGEFSIEENNLQPEVILTRQDLLQELSNAFTEIGFTSKLVDSSLDLSVEDSVERISFTIEQHLNQFNTVLIWAGEPTISLSNEVVRNGQGGRISSLCCLLAEKLETHRNVLFIGLATDAQDGTSPVAAYFIDHNTSHHLRPLGGARKIISQGNSGYALKILNYGIELSHTNMNLADLYLAFIN